MKSKFWDAVFASLIAITAWLWAGEREARRCVEDWIDRGGMLAEDGPCDRASKVLAVCAVVVAVAMCVAGLLAAVRR